MVSIQYSSNISRHETAGIRTEYLRDATPLRQVQKKIQDFLCNGEPMWKISPRGGKARILVGHDLDRLHLEYPAVMMRLSFSPKLSYTSHSLKNNCLDLLLIIYQFKL